MASCNPFSRYANYTMHSRSCPVRRQPSVYDTIFRNADSLGSLGRKSLADVAFSLVFLREVHYARASPGREQAMS